MTDMVLWEGKLPVERKLAKTLALHCGTIHLVAEVARVAMDQVSDLHGYAEYKVVTTLAAAELVQQGASSSVEPIPLEGAARSYRTKSYLDGMTRITETADARIVALANDLPS